MRSKTTPTMMYCYIHTGQAHVERAGNVNTGKCSDTGLAYVAGVSVEL